GQQLLQLSVDHDRHFRHVRIPELPEQRGRLVVLHAGLPLFVLIDQQPCRGVQADPDVVLHHLDGDQDITELILDRLFRLAGQAQQSPIIAGPEEREAARPGHPLEPGPDGLEVGPVSQLVEDRRVELPQPRLQRGGDLADRFPRLHADMLDQDLFLCRLTHGFAPLSTGLLAPVTRIERCRMPEMQSRRRPSHSKALRCSSIKASSDFGGRPPIVSITSLVPAKMPAWWSVATSRRCCRTNDSLSSPRCHCSGSPYMVRALTWPGAGDPRDAMLWAISSTVT